MKKVLISVSEPLPKEYVDAITLVGGTADIYYLPICIDQFHMSFYELLDFFSKKYDALILGGGGDVNPYRFGEEINGSTRIDDARDVWEFHLIEKFMQLRKPIMGICRGFQVMNVALGGSLYQDNGEAGNKYHTSPDKTFKVHSTYCKPSFLQDLYGNEFNVNSHHHQSLKEVASDLIPIQYSSDCRCVEGVIHKSYPYIGVQWHPERLCQPNIKEERCVDGTRIFEYFMQLK